MKYFTKYLPVEGEIKMGGNVPVIKAGKLTFFTIETPEKFEIFNKMVSLSSVTYFPAKLFLCSRDIQVGDFFTYKGEKHQLVQDRYDGYYSHYEEVGGEVIAYGSEFLTRFPKEECYHVIGEISPEATWVMEGQEMKEDEIKHYYKTHKGVDFRLPSYPLDYIIYIKGPCGHFH